MKQTDKVQPVTIETDLQVEKNHRDQKGRDERAPASTVLVDKMASALPDLRDNRFTCFGDIWCGAHFRGVSLITVSDAAYLGAACDLADIVVTPVAVHMEQCRSGALLFTGRTLRRTGSTEIYIRPEDRNIVQGKDSALDKGDREAARSNGARLRVVSALAGVIRPWTIQRYYDWRTRSFDFNGKTLSDTAG